jgi:TolA-binding protein
LRRFFLISLIVIIAAGIVVAGFFSHRSREEVLYEKGVSALDENLSGAAVEYFTTLIVTYPESPLYPEALRHRATVYHLYQSRYLEAISDFREFLERYPENKYAFEARRAIAEILETKIRDCRRAIVEYQRLIDDYETVVEDDLFQYRIARCYYDLLEFEQAKLEFYKLINGYPGSPMVDDAYYQIANILQTQGALVDAEAAYRLYLARYPEGMQVLDARFNLAATLEEMELLEEALDLYNEIFPDYPNKEAISWRLEKARKRLEERGR